MATQTVRMITLMAGPGGIFQPGQVVNLPAKAAQALVAGGYATAEGTPLATSPGGEGEETAAVEPVERAVKPSPRRRKTAKKPAGDK